MQVPPFLFFYKLEISYNEVKRRHKLVTIIFTIKLTLLPKIFFCVEFEDFEVLSKCSYQSWYQKHLLLSELPTLKFSSFCSSLQYN